MIVLEDYAGKGSRRCQRIQWLINDISQLAAKQKIRVRSFSRAKVKQTFGESGASNKYEIAIAIAKRSRAHDTFTTFQKTMDERRLPDEYF